MQPWDAFAFQPEYLSALRPRRNLHLYFAIERRHVDICPERCLSEGDRHLAKHLGVLANENRVLLDVDDHVEISGPTAALSGLALARESNSGARVDAGGNLHPQL